ncbi:MAG TPA: hypothetical protein VGK67_41325 [Myxococcales bacterium]
MKKLRRVLPLLAVVGLAACGSSNPLTGVQCEAAGGQCLLGNVLGPCPGGIEAMDCNPSQNPGGGHCCLPCPSGKTPVDGGQGCQ